MKTHKILKTYKLFKIKEGKLYPLYVGADKEVLKDRWLQSTCGKAVDETHVKARGCGGRLRMRSGWHSTLIPFTDWIGQKDEDGKLRQRPDTVWCECDVMGDEIEVSDRFGLLKVPEDKYYKFKTNTKQKDPWIISDWIFVRRILSHEEVKEICAAHGIEAQELAE